MFMWCMAWCECTLVGMQWMQMPPCWYVVMRMSPWCMLWCKCLLGACYDANVCLDMQWMQLPSCRYAMNANAPLWVYHDMECFGTNTIYSKFLLFSKRGFHNAWNQNIFKLDLLFMKSHLPFDLRFPKNWWSPLEISEWGIYLKSDDLAQKDLFSQFG